MKRAAGMACEVAAAPEFAKWAAAGAAALLPPQWRARQRPPLSGPPMGLQRRRGDPSLGHTLGTTAMLGHISFGVTDLARAMAFYDAVLAPLGLVRVWSGGSSAGWGPAGGGREVRG